METRVFATLCALLLWATPILNPFDGSAHAAVFFDDSFEGSNPPATGWGWSCNNYPTSPCLLDVSTDIAHAGSKSLKLTYNLAWSDPNPQTHQASVYKGFGASYTDVYLRYWYRTAGGFSYGTAGTKHNIYSGTLQYPRFYAINSFGSKEMGFALEISADCGYSSCNTFPNMGRVPFTDNVWYCVEEHVKLNTAGVSDGALEIWINGTQTVGSYNRMLRGPAVNGPNGNSSTKTHDNINIYKQNGGGNYSKAQAGWTGAGPAGGYGIIYLDQFAAGNTRIGCGGSGVQTDTTPPGPPVGFSVR